MKAQQSPFLAHENAENESKGKLSIEDLQLPLLDGNRGQPTSKPTNANGDPKSKLPQPSNYNTSPDSPSKEPPKVSNVLKSPSKDRQLPRQQSNEATPMVYSKQSVPESVKPSQVASEERTAHKHNANASERPAKASPSRPDNNERDSRTSANATRYHRSGDSEPSAYEMSPSNATSKSSSIERHRNLGCAQKIVFPALNELSNRYKANLGNYNTRSDAIDDLKVAFESVEKEVPGVCDFFVKEIVSSLTDLRHYHQFIDTMAGSKHRPSSTSGPNAEPLPHHQQPSNQPQSRAQPSPGRLKSNFN
jgi:hypothetical protein